MTYYFGSNLHQFLPQGGQGPVADLPGQHQPTEKVTQIIGQSEQLQSNLIVHKVVAGKSSPVQGVFAFLDPLFSGTPLIVEAHHILGFPAEIGNDKIHSGKQFIRMPLHLGDR